MFWSLLCKPYAEATFSSCLGCADRGTNYAQTLNTKANIEFHGPFSLEQYTEQTFNLLRTIYTSIFSYFHVYCIIYFSLVLQVAPITLRQLLLVIVHNKYSTLPMLPVGLSFKIIRRLRAQLY